MDSIVTIFKNIRVVTDPHYRGVDFILQRIKAGNSKKLLEKVRAEKNKTKRDKLKADLPSICFSGKFKQRNNYSLLTHSGLIILDFDSVGDPAKLRDELSKDEYIFSAFISPSGNGVKALVKIVTEDHVGSYRALATRYDNLDESGKDVARVCYESYDPDIYINKDSKIFTKILVKELKEISRISKDVTASDIYNKLKTWLDKRGEFYTLGNRNNFLYKLLCACNRFGIDADEAQSLILMDYLGGSSDFELSEFNQLIKSSYGRYRAEFGSVEFDKTDVRVIETQVIIEAEIIDLEAPPTDILLLNDIKDDMLYSFRNGIKEGETTHIRTLDRHWRWSKGELSMIYGVGNLGKSAMSVYLMMLKSVFDGWVFCVYSPEHTAEKFYNTLIQVYIGQTVMKGNWQMSEENYIKAAKFVNEHFLFLHPPDEQLPTPEYINKTFREAIKKKRVDCVVVDPWNQMHHDLGGQREDLYLAVVLRELKQFALRENIVYLLVAHCNGRVAQTATGDLEKPYYAFHISGGAMWGNKMDNILLYHRPFYRSQPDDTHCILESQKVKDQQRNGRPGNVDFAYSLQTFRFLDLDGDGEDPLMTTDFKEVMEKHFKEDLPF